MKKSVLPASFYQRDTTIVARELLGMRLCRRHEDGHVSTGIIVETEAYLGKEDRAAHSFGGRRTERTEIMYGDGGAAYVYLIYGMYYCLNAVTRTKDEPEAVLMRALQAEVDHPEWLGKFPRLRREQWLSGPGRLCRALQIDKVQNGVSLQSDGLWIEKGGEAACGEVLASPRIGVDYAEEAALWPLRFYLRDCAAVSRRK